MNTRQRRRIKMRQAAALLASATRQQEAHEAAFQQGVKAAMQDKALQGRGARAGVMAGKTYCPLPEESFRKANPYTGKKQWEPALCRAEEPSWADGYRAGKACDVEVREAPVDQAALSEYLQRNRGGSSVSIVIEGKATQGSTVSRGYLPAERPLTRAEVLADREAALQQRETHASLMAQIRTSNTTRGSQYSGGSK